jgi:PPOX class probable F420-dependent enzyme
MATIGLQRSHAEDEIPDSHRDLVERPPVAAITTLMPDGSPQTSVVWCDAEGGLVRVNTMRGFRKERNMRRDPRVTLLCYDPREPLRYLEVRGVVEDMTDDGALDHLDALASAYMGRPVRYFGDCIAERFAETEEPVLCRIRPLHVVAVDATARGPASGSGDHAAAGQPGPGQPSSLGALPPSAVEQALPASHLDLFERDLCGVLTTLLTGGQPHSCLVWVDRDGDTARVNTTLQRQSGRNLLADPRLSLLVVDPANTARFVQVRGLGELTCDGALEHLDALTRRYTGHPRYYGFVYPEKQAGLEQRVIVRIRARRVTLDAIHA